MLLRFQIYKFLFEMSYEDRTFSVEGYWDNRVLINHQKTFVKYFRCAMCKAHVPDEGEKLRLCEEHYEHFISLVEERLQK